VARVTAFEIPGLTIWFWSNDHEPPHFHVKRRGEWEVKVHFLLDGNQMIEVLNGKPAGKTLKQIITLAEAHRLELLEQWQTLRENEQGE
jgi:hypothetical protein